MAGARRARRESFTIGERQVAPGRRELVELPVARLFTGSLLSLPVVVIHGRAPGPRVWLSAAIHGDEINGIEIVSAVLRRLDPRRLRGTVLAVPVVNVFGLVHQTRYLPDRRDLNRSFPGSPRGSLAARLAHLFLAEVVHRSTHGIDLHTGSLHRTNLPQLRVDLADPEARRLAHGFGAPLAIQSTLIRGSLREAAATAGVTYLLYEAGEPLRFDPRAIEVGRAGVLRVLGALGMWDDAPAPEPPPAEAHQSRWLRAGRSGVFHLDAALGDRVTRGQVLGAISDPVSDPFARHQRKLRAPAAGMVIGFTNNPLVHQGDALIHLATIARD